MTSGYRETYDRWRADPQGFLAEAARELAWTKPPERIFEAEAGSTALVSRRTLQRLFHCAT